MGAEVMSQTITALEKGEITPEKQDDALSNYAPMLTKELCPIDWNLTAQEVHNKVRGLSPWPGATALCGDKLFKIHKTVLAGEVKGAAGEITESGKRLVVACGDGNGVEIITLQAQGKKAMPAADFLRGNPIPAGEFFK